MNRQRRGGFTLVELLVVIAIIGILISMMLPAIQAARDAAERSQCSGNLQRLILAVQSYENSQTFYPAGVTDTAGPIRSRPQGLHHNWVLRVLPFLDERVAFAKVDFGVNIYDKKNADLAAWHLPELLCPADSDQRPHSNYAACQNDVEAPIDADNHGVFFLNSRLRPDDITDGLAYTLLLAEKQCEPDQPELGWMSGTRATLRNTGTRLDGTAGQTPVARGQGPGTVISSTYVGGFGSQHGGGLTMAALGDGSVRALANTIDPTLLKRLGNRADGQMVDLRELCP